MPLARADKGETMSRLVLDLPDNFHFTTKLSVRVTDLNYGNHLGNDSLISLLHEARMRFLTHYGFSELDIGGCGILIADLAVIYRSEAFYGDELKFEVGVADFVKYGCDVNYRVTLAETGKEVALAKTGIVFFDYGQRKLLSVPAVFKSLFAAT
jgi:acyl-CoA thioesterase FadM